MTTPNTNSGMFLIVSGKPRRVADLEAAARMYRQIWDNAASAGRIIRGATIAVDGMAVYRVSQNGKIWADEWAPGVKPVFEL